MGKLSKRAGRTWSCIICSRAKWNFEGEKPSKYFCALEKANNNEKYIAGLKTVNGITSCQEKISQEACRFYKELYDCSDCRKGTCKIHNNVAPCHEEINTFLNSEAVPKIEENAAKNLEERISYDEATYCVKNNLKKGTAPGARDLLQSSGRYFGADSELLLWTQLMSHWKKVYSQQSKDRE